MIRRPPRSTLFPTRRSSDLHGNGELHPHRSERRRVECVQGSRPRLGRSDHLDCRRRRHHVGLARDEDRKSTRLNSSHSQISYAVFCLKKKKKNKILSPTISI